MSQASATQDCPFCREPIAAGATKCKHCGSSIDIGLQPDHEGTCPHCREAINPDALRCKHCRTFLVDGLDETPFTDLEVSDGFTPVPGDVVERPVGGRYGRWVCEPKRICSPVWGWQIVGPSGQKRWGYTIVCRTQLACHIA